jgi:hypothetical protein
MLAGYGYPEFNDLDPEANLGVFVVLSPTAPQPQIIGALKLMPGAEQTPMMLEQQGLSLMETDGWTFVARNPGALETLGGPIAPDALTGLLQDDPVADLGLTIFTDFAIAQRPALEPMLMGMLEAEAAEAESGEDGNPELAQKALPLVKAFGGLSFDVLADLESISLGVDLGEADLGLLLGARARPDTPLGALFSQEVSGSTAAGAYLPDAGALRIVADFDTEAQLAYIEWAAERLKADLPGSMIARIDTILAQMEPLWDHTGEWAISADMAGLKAAQTQIVLGDLDADGVHAAYAGLIGETLPGILQVLAEAEAEGEEGETIDFAEVFDIAYETDVATVAGVSVARLTSRVGLPEADAEAMAALDEDLLVQEQFFAVTGGNLVQATSLERLEGAVKALVQGEPVPGNMADRFQAAPGVALQGTFDPIAYYLPVLETLVGSFDADPGMAAILEQVQDLELTPLGFSGTVGDHYATIRGDLPYATVRTLAQKGMEFQAAQAAREAEAAEADESADAAAPAAEGEAEPMP